MGTNALFGEMVGSWNKSPSCRTYCINRDFFHPDFNIHTPIDSPCLVY
jgi:hypothetical protein